MAEVVAVIGLVASIISLVKGARTALQLAINLKKALDEIISLQGELERFHRVVQEFGNFSGDRDLLNGFIELELSWSKETVRKIQTFIESSLLRNAIPSRRSWVRKKGRMVQLREELRMVRSQPMLGMMALNSASSIKASANLEKVAENAESMNRTLREFCAHTNSTETLMQQLPKAVEDAYKPASAFELSSRFFPEQYSISTTTRDSIFWGPGQLPKRAPSNLSISGRIPFPKPLERELEHHLLEDNPMNDATVLFAELSGRQFEESALEIRSTVLQDSLCAVMQLLDFVKDLGCPIYSEGVSFQLNTPQPCYFVCALSDGRMCLERRLQSETIDLKEMKWELSLYHCLKDSPHVTNLVGVITDHKAGYVKSILTDSEPGRIWSLIEEASEKKQIIPLETRLMWARQIITGVRDIHEKGFVIGKLDIYMLGTDRSGYIQLHGYCREGGFLNHTGLSYST